MPHIHPDKVVALLLFAALAIALASGNSPILIESVGASAGAVGAGYAILRRRE